MISGALRRKTDWLLLAGAVGTAALVGCSDTTGGDARPLASLSLVPVLPATVQPGVFDLAVDRVRIRLIRPPAEAVLDTVIFFPSDQTQLTIRLKVPLVARRELLLAGLELLSKNILLFAGTDTIEVSEAGGIAPPIPLQFVGPGANLTRVRIVPGDTALKPGDRFSFGVTAEADGAPVGLFYVGWSTSDPSMAPVNAVGTLTAPFQRGSVMLRVVTPNGVKDSTRISFAPPASAIALAGGDNQRWFAGLQLPELLVVKVVSGDDLGTPGVRVRFRSLNGGRVLDTLATTDATGAARTLGFLGPVAGPQQFEAEAPGFPVIVFRETALTGSAARIETLAGSGQVDSVGRTLRTALIARVTDFVGNPVAGVAVTWQVLAGGGTLDRSAGVTNLSGVAFADYTLGRFPGQNIVRISMTAPSAAADFSATAIPGSPAGISVFVGGGQVDTAAATLDPLVALVMDRFSNLLTGIPVRWSEVQGGGALAPVTAPTDALGRAITTYSLPTAAGLADVVAEVVGQPLTVLFRSTVTAAAPFAIVIQSGDAQSDVAAAVLAPFAVRVTDRFGNPVAGAVVAWEVTAGGGTLSAATSATDAAGVATATYTLGPAPGVNTVQARLTSGSLAELIFTATAVP